MPEFEDRTDPEDETLTDSDQTASGDADPTPSAFSYDTWDDWYARHLRDAAPPTSGSWPGGESGEGGEAGDGGTDALGAEWHAMRQQDQAAGRGAGGTGAHDAESAWMEGLEWEDLSLLRYLADCHSPETSKESRGLGRQPISLPDAWLEGVTWEDLIFVKTLAEARRTVQQNESNGAGQGRLPTFSAPPVSYGPAEPRSEPPLLLRLKAYRALHPEKFGRGGAGAGSASRTSSAAGGVGQQRPAGELQRGPQDPSENPELAAYRRWPRPPLPSDNPEFGAYWRWPRPQGPLPSARPTPTARSTATAKATRTLTPPQNEAPELEDDDVERVAKALVGEAGVFPDKERKQNYEAIAWVWRNKVFQGGGHYKDYTGEFHGYKDSIVPTDEAMDVANRIMREKTNELDPTNGAIHFKSYHDLIRDGFTPQEIRAAVDNGLFNYQVEWWKSKGTETPPSTPPLYAHYFFSKWPGPIPTRTRTAGPSQTPTRPATRTRTRTPTASSTRPLTATPRGR